MTATAPPRWDLTPLFPGLDDRSFTATLEGVYADVDRLVALFDEHGIGATAPRPVTDADVQLLDTVIGESNELQRRLRTVNAYLYGLVTTDSRDDAAAAHLVELQTRTAALGPLTKRLGAWGRRARRRAVRRAQRARGRARVRAAQRRRERAGTR
ncbi:MAG: hypothetical protein KatS3mg010_0713 [Acidimicrobiia bacterium]|nr:MAG: hypothetical protein KatS3mg010_0713 [Acidimicrobiia bacterium]